VGDLSLETAAVPGRGCTKNGVFEWGKNQGKPWHFQVLYFHAMAAKIIDPPIKVSDCFGF